MTRDFTATTFVVHEGCVLLHEHAKLRKILPPGGHIETNELPEEAALREVYEETGLEITLAGGADADSRDGGSAGAGSNAGTADARHLITPITLLLEDISEGHQHIDFIYFGEPSDSSAARRLPRWNEEEPAGGFYWMHGEELDRAVMPPSVRELARRALSELGRT